MLTLLQEQERQAEMLPLQPPLQRRSPGLAFALSLLFPGLGHAYLRSWKIAAWTAGTFLFALLCGLAETPILLGMFLVGVPALYIFGAADGFCAAREWNAGATDRLIGTNPRIATVLNLLTRGFGYFYLGQRGKGIAVIVVVTALLPLMGTPWLRVAAIVIQVGIAADGYRIARQQLLATNPELRPLPSEPAFAGGDTQNGEEVDPIDLANRGTLAPAVVQCSLAVLAGLALFAILAFNVVNGRANRAPGTVEVDESGLHYRNAAIGIEFTAPEGWQTQPRGDALFQARDGSCVLVVVDNTLVLGSKAFQTGLRKGILKNHPDATFSEGPRWPGQGRVPESISATMLVHDKVLRQNWFGLRHGTHLTSLLELYPTENESCLGAFQQIEKSVVVH